MLDYLNQTLGLEATLSPWTDSEQLPLYLRSGKKYSLLHIGGMECVFIEADENSFSLPAFRKQLAKLPTEPGNVVLCFRHLDSRKRKALIQAGMAFIVPNSQIYLPFLGIVLQERMKTVKAPPKKLSPAAQLILLYLICKPTAQPIRKVELAKQLDLSAMNVTRAVQDLEPLALVRVERVGRSDHVSAAGSGRSLWEKALPYLIDPVQRRLSVRKAADLKETPLAGESALAKRSMLASPATECRAISRKEYKQIKGVEEIDPAWSSDQNYIQLELWKYDPKLLADCSGVDMFSLFLSLRDHGDERVEQALEEMMEGCQW